MSLIKIKGRVDGIKVSYSTAKKIKQMKFGDDTVFPVISKAKATDLIDLGEEWAGEFGQIASIQIGEVSSKYQIEQPDELPLTPEQKLETRKIIDKMTITLKENKVLPDNYPNHRQPRPYEVLRSELVKYKETYGRDFSVPNGSMIIED